MILAAGLTPAWQQILLFDALLPGEVNRAREAHWCASGKVLNVGIAVHQLGAESLTLSPLGGWAHAAVEADLARLDVPRRWLFSSVPTRVCTTILDSQSGMTTELVENARPLPDDELERYREAFRHEAARAACIVLSGSLPEGTPADYYSTLIADVAAPVILDARGNELLAALEHRPFLVKPNREELARTLETRITSEDELLAAMRELNQRGAQWVIVTQGKETLWATSTTEVHRFTPLEVPVVNPIGCGDSLAAGVAVAIAEGKSVPEAIELGMAAAAENARHLLPARLDRQRVLQLRVELQSSSRGQSQ